MSRSEMHHIDILRRVRAGKRLRRSNSALAEEVDRLVALRFIEPTGSVGRYRITATGAVVLKALEGPVRNGHG